MNDGTWNTVRDYSTGGTGKITGWTLRIGAVFDAEVSLDESGSWRARLNSAPLGGYPDPEQAKATVDRQIWIEATKAREGLKAVKEREANWKRWCP